MALSGKEKVGVYLMGLVLGTIIVSMMPRNEEKGDKSHWHDQTAPTGYYPLEVKDAFSRDILLERQPRHFISLAPSVTESFYAMGLGDHLMAVTKWCNYPVEARALKNVGAHIGSMDNPSAEAIVAYHADIIVGSKLTPMEVYELIDSRSKTKSIALAWDRLDNIRESIKQLGILTGVPGMALELTSKLNREWDSIKDEVNLLEQSTDKVPTAVFMLGIQDGNQPGWVSGEASWVTDLVEEAGLENAASRIGKSWGQINMENLIALNPDVLLIRQPESNAGVEALKKSIASLKDDSTWGHLQAVRSGQVYLLSYGPFSIPGPRYIDAFSELAKIRKSYSATQLGQVP